MFGLSKRIRQMLATLDLFFLVLLALSVSTQVTAARRINQTQSDSLNQLEQKLKTQYATIEAVIANPPGISQPAVILLPGQSANAVDVEGHRRRIRQWQVEVAQSFKAAADTVAEILKLNLNAPDRDFWSERLETLQLYSQPVSPPDQRTVFGSREVQKRAKLLDTPLPEYTAQAQVAKARGEVRLRLVLAAHRTVKHVFPIKSLGHGLTESAVAAARKINFQPAIRNGSAASQFLTLVYEFQSGRARKPYIPQTEF